jgi:hypothetical protein
VFRVLSRIFGIRTLIQLRERFLKPRNISW